MKSLNHGYVSKSILDAAGIELSRECRKKYPQGIEYCEVAVTPSFQLKQCKRIYHGGIPYFKESLEVSTERLCMFIRIFNFLIDYDTLINQSYCLFIFLYQVSLITFSCQRGGYIKKIYTL